MRQIFALLVAAASFAVAPSVSSAAQTTDGSGHVVHSRRAPVVMHRIVPPYRGVHVYGGR
ncbi:MAG: hypothetical protein QM811_25185 [Pirellulales bacterium]